MATREDTRSKYLGQSRGGGVLFSERGSDFRQNTDRQTPAKPHKIFFIILPSIVPPVGRDEPPAGQQPGSPGPQAGQHHEVHPGRRLCRLQANRLWGGARAAGRPAVRVAVRDGGVSPSRHVRAGGPEVSFIFWFSSYAEKYLY